MTAFDSFKLAVVSQVTDLIDRGVITDKSLQQLAFDLVQLSHTQDKFLLSLLKTNPDKYLQK